MTTNEKLQALRSLMEQKGLDAYVVPSSDPHISEYVPDHDRCRAWLSGFTGSAGTVAVTKEQSLLWADGRYWIQAARQIADSEVELCKMGMAGVPTYTEWLCGHMEKGQTVGIDGRLFSVSQRDSLKTALEAKGVGLNTEYDLIAPLWTQNRPALPSEKAFVHDIRFTGLTAAQKLGQVREKMEKLGGVFYIVTALDSIAWLYNVRGRDIHTNPVVCSYALVGKDCAVWFVDENKVTPEVAAHAKKNGIEIRPYDGIYAALQSVTGSIVLDKDKVNCALESAVPSAVRRIYEPDLVTAMKAVKNETELAGMKTANRKDCVAVTKLLCWLDQSIGRQTITEYEIGERLTENRRQQANFLEDSFDTIAGYGANAAMMHYKAEKDTCATLEPRGFLLIDTGGQYLDGTTDITRTAVLGPLTDEEKHDFTYVLKSAIALITARFLEGTYGGSLDLVARKPLWDIGIDYKCGTGHGVGFCLNVHEGPQNFGRASFAAKVEPGMVTTVEPGVYKENKFGIRTENTVVAVLDEKTPDAGQFYRFDLLSYCPIDRRGIDPALLTEAELSFINNYHARVYETLRDGLTDDERDWLAGMCAPIVR